MQNSAKVVRTTEVGLEALDFEGILEDVFKDRTACTRTFGQLFNTATPPAITREGFAPSNANILDTNGIYNANEEIMWQQDDLVIGGLKLVSMTIPLTKMDLNTGTSIQNYTSINSSLNKGYVELNILFEKTGKSARSFGGRDKQIKLYLATEVYNDVPGATKDHRIKECQLSGSEVITTAAPPTCYSLRRYERIDYNRGFLNEVGSLVSTQDGLDYLDVVRLDGGCCTGGSSTQYPPTRLTTVPLTTSSPSAWFGIECREDKGFYMYSCGHASMDDSGDSDILYTANGCYANDNDGTRRNNSIDIRCCRTN